MIDSIAVINNFLINFLYENFNGGNNMFNTIVPITKQEHQNKKVKPTNGFKFVQNVHLASVMVHEFSRVAPIYPIVFLEDTKKDEFRPVVMLGLEAGENLFVEDGNWNASYVPAIIRRYPFALASINDENKYTVCIDSSSEFINDTEGEPLFDSNGEPSQAMEKVKQYLVQLQQMENFTVAFCKYMQEKNMFTPLNMKVKVGEEIKNITGAYIINEERLASLSSEIFLDLREKKYLAVIYSHLSSLGQIERLLKFKDKSVGVIKKIEERFQEGKE